MPIRRCWLHDAPSAIHARPPPPPRRPRADNGGICAASAYPYTGNPSGICNNCTKVAAITGFTDLPKSEAGLMTGIAGGSVAVAVEADQDAFQFYSGGVLTGACGNNVDHTLVAVGYGTDAANGGDYYKVRGTVGGWARRRCSHGLTPHPRRRDRSARTAGARRGARRGTSAWAAGRPSAAGASAVCRPRRRS
jgi:hypothetical protein